MRRSSLLRITAITGTLICLAVLAIAQDNAPPARLIQPKSPSKTPQLRNPCLSNPRSRG